MAPRIIYQSPANANTPGARWLIVQDPTDRHNPNLVRFHRSNGPRNLLDQIAEWDPHAQAWTCRRWVPRHPKVPQFLIDKVVAHMSFEDRA
jgi:hypothetical protein